MRTALLLPASTLVVAAAGLALPSPDTLRSMHTQAPTATRVGTSAAVDPRQAEAPRAAAGSTGIAPPRLRPSLRGRWEWPLSPTPAIVRRFVRPASDYGAGHRGIDLAGSTRQEVLAVDAGTVTHVGRIAGRGTVTVAHPSGVRSTYEPVEPAVTVGDVVARGSRLGRLEGTGTHCRPVCLHLGALRGRAYLDPLVLLTGGRPVRLLPLAQAPEG